MSETKYIERYWRKATGTDIAKGPFPVARFRDGETEPWESGRLIGFHHGTNRPYGSDEDWFQEAQVYDAPDPGEGYELIDPDTVKREPSDERWHPALQKWLSPDDCYSDHYEEVHVYRRKIVQSPTSESVAAPAASENGGTGGDCKHAVGDVRLHRADRGLLRRTTWS